MSIEDFKDARDFLLALRTDYSTAKAKFAWPKFDCKDLGRSAMQEVTEILKKSIQFSLDHRQEAVEYALQFGRDLNHELADQFVGMYVNAWTLDYGIRGREAITRLLKEGKGGISPRSGGD